MKKYKIFIDGANGETAEKQLNDFIEKNKNRSVVEVECFKVVRYESLNTERVYIFASYHEGY